MALKLVKPQLHRQQSRKTSKKPCSVTKPPVDDPWSFLELIDAPRWADLSLEADLMRKEGDDPWFHISHEHHVISLGDLNSKMTCPRHAQPSQLNSQANQTKRTVSSKDPVKGRRRKEANSKVDCIGQLNKPGHGQCWPRNQIKRIQLQKDSAFQDMKSIYRCSGPQASESTLSGSSCTPECGKSGLLNHGSSCSERLNISSTLQDLSIESSNFSSRVHNGPQASESTVSGSSCTPECAKSESLNNASSCSERLNISSTLQGVSIESSNLSSSAHNGKLGSEQSRISSNIRDCSDSQYGKTDRNSSGASFCTLRPKLRFSYELHLSKSTIDQAVHAVDYRSSAGSVTAQSCLKPEVQVTSRGSRIQAGNLDKESECSGYDQPSSSESKGESNKLNGRLIHCHEAARIIAKDESFPVAVRTRSCSNIKERATEVRGSHVGSFPRKQLVSGKGTVQQTKAGKGQIQESKCQTKPKLANTIVRSSLVRPKVQDGKWGSVDCDHLRCNTEESCPKRSPLDCFAQMASGRTRQDLKGQSIPTAVLDRRRTGQTSGGSAQENSSKFDSSEQDLAALVAQHNRKIRSLGTQGRKNVSHAA